MTIKPTVDVFPMNVINLMAVRLQTLDGDLMVVKRSLRDSDGTQSIGVYPIVWTPDETSYEMIGSDASNPKAEPTLQRYVIGVQSYVKDTDEEQGIAVHAILSKMIRSLLYRDAVLAVGLNALSVTMNGSTERIQRRGISTQRFLASEVQGVFMYLSSLEYFVETETV